jgi:hypothetical protein
VGYVKLMAGHFPNQLAAASTQQRLLLQRLVEKQASVFFVLTRSMENRYAL